MNAADRFSREIAQEQQESDEQLRRRVAEPTLVFKDHITETSASPPSPRSIKAEINKQLASRLKSRDRIFIDAVAEFVVLRGRKLREELRADDDVIKDQLQRLQGEVTTLREQAAQDRTLASRSAEADCVEREQLRREITQLRDQLALERGLRTLHDEVATARSKIPNYDALEARVNSEQSNLEAKQARLARELKATRDKLATLRADQSQIDYKISEHIREAPPPAVELNFVSEDGQFTMRDLHPDAKQAWRLFVKEMVAANDGKMFPKDPNGHIVPLVARKPEGNA